MKRNAINNEQLKDIKRDVFAWYLSFAILFISSVIFCFCFLLERNIVLYGILTLLFLIFIIMYLHYNKKITLECGYTYIQAMNYYKSVNAVTGNIEFEEALFKIACQKEYAEGLDLEKLKKLYSIGEQLFEYVKKGD